MRAELKAIQKRLGFTTLIVTHDQIEAITMADRIICMNNGAIAQIGTPDDLYRRPNNLFVAGFIGTPPMNLISAEAAGSNLIVGQATLALTSPNIGEMTLGLRPEDIALVSPEAAALSGTIVAVEPMGREVFYTVDTPAGLIHALEYGEIVRHARGVPVGLSCKPELSLLFDDDGNRIVDLHADLAHRAEAKTDQLALLN